jgi:sulfide:quinone oxidoreductase
VPITWVTPEPALGHFGIGGIKDGDLMLKLFFDWQGVEKSLILKYREGWSFLP